MVLRDDRTITREACLHLGSALVAYGGPGSTEARMGYFFVRQACSVAFWEHWQTTLDISRESQVRQIEQYMSTLIKALGVKL